MGNSIKESLTKEDAISEIRLLINKDKNTVAVVVEGPDDGRLFTPILSKTVSIVQSHSGKTGVEEIVATLSNNRVIGIRDKDYADPQRLKQLFYCDYCCAEMMIVSVEHCFMRLYVNYCQKQGSDYGTIMLDLLKRLELLSKLRMLNEKEHWGISFKGISISAAFNASIDEMNEKLKKQLNAVNQNAITKTRINKCLKIMSDPKLEDYLNITNGHDFISLFAKIYSSRRKALSEDSIAMALRTSFGINEFQRTVLYNSLKHYEETYSLRITLQNP